MPTDPASSGQVQQDGHPKSDHASKGTSLAQEGGGGKNKKKTFDKEYWKDKECYNCHEKGHPSLHCPKKKKDDDDVSTASTKSTISKLEKQIKSMKKKFITVNTQLQSLQEAASDMSDSDDDESEEEASHFQFQFMQVEPEFEPRIAMLLKQVHIASKLKIDLQEVILLDSQSTMDLFCNPAFVEKTMRSSTTMRLKSNGSLMVVHCKATLNGYHNKVWFSRQAITNILALSNLIKQYHVTYDSNELMFVVH